LNAVSHQALISIWRRRSITISCILHHQSRLPLLPLNRLELVASEAVIKSMMLVPLGTRLI